MTRPVVAQATVRLAKAEPGGETPGVPASDGRRWGFALARDTSGKEDERPVMPQWTYVGWTPTYSGASEGYAVVRLYCASYLAPKIKVAGNNSKSPVEFIGQREEKISEAVTFTGSAEAKLSKGHNATDVAVIDSTSFFDKDGKAAQAPSGVPGEPGVFRASGEVYGALMVEYTARYKVWRIPYGLPDHIAQALFVQGKPRDELTIPPVHVFAFAAGGYAASLSFERRIGELDVSVDCSNSWVLDNSASVKKKFKIYDPEDLNPDGSPKPNASYIEEERYVKVVRYCSSDPTKIRVEHYPE